MLDIAAIRCSNSPCASPVVLVRKKDGTIRFCINCRTLNAWTVKDAYSIPRIEDALDSLNGACIFTSLHLRSGYRQVELDNESIPLTAFTVGPLGFYECVRMPFDLTNAPATFERLMESHLGDLHLSWCIIYLDDIIIFSKNPDDLHSTISHFNEAKKTRKVCLCYSLLLFHHNHKPKIFNLWFMSQCNLPNTFTLVSICIKYISLLL